MAGAADSPRVPCVNRAIALAASTGGPAALERVLFDLATCLRENDALAAMLPPVFITQHLSAPFNTLLAARLSASSGLCCAEAAAGHEIRAGNVYIAPDGVHMGVLRKCGQAPHLCLMQTPPVHFCRPAADPMLESLAGVYGENLLAVILTGMGKDGATGCRAVAARGGKIWIQDAPSSVVWGMPGAVAVTGTASRVLPLEDIGAALWAWITAGDSL